MVGVVSLPAFELWSFWSLSMLDPVEVVFFGCFVFLFLVQAKGFSGFGQWRREDVGGSSAKMFFDARSTSLGWVVVDRSLSSVVLLGLIWSWLSLDGAMWLVLAGRVASTHQGASSLGSRVRIIACISGLG